MNNNDVVVSLIKEIVKNEVKQQVKEEILKLVKSGVLSINSNKQGVAVKEAKSLNPAPKKPTLASAVIKENVQQQARPMKQYSKNPLINEILNKTTPFSKEERAVIAEGGMGLGGGSVLDQVKAIPTPPVAKEGYEEWPTITKTTDDLNSIAYNKPMDEPVIDTSTDVGKQQAAVIKALKRNYKDLVKRFNRWQLD